MSARKTRIMYIERKAESLNGPARIGRVTLSKSGRTLEYKGQKFAKTKTGAKWNHFDVATGDEYWISGPRRDGKDRLYPMSSLPVEIDEDVREEYWSKIRGASAATHRTRSS
jgi:hypothetical protein